MLEIIGIKVCLKPNKKQETKLFTYVNHSRGLWNILLGKAQDEYEENKTPANFKNFYKYYKEFKKSEEYGWLNEMPEACGKQVCKDLHEAYKRVFKSEFGFPKFKKKGKCKDSFYQRTDTLKFNPEKNKCYITGIGWLKCKKGNYPEKGFCNPRVTFDGKNWFLSFSIKGCFEESLDLNEQTDGIGIDVGIKEFATLSNGTVYENYNNLDELKRLNKKLEKLQQVVSRKYELNKIGEKFVKTKNILKLEKKIKLVYRRIKNIKINELHNITKSLVKAKPKFIAVENLDIKAMKEADNNLSESIQQVAWYEFFRQLKYKCSLYNISFIQVDEYFPSSKLCSCCGNIQEMPLEIRTYECNCCNTIIDRDLNAAINIKEEGKKILGLA